jgi:hypothetical protein
LPNLLPLVLTEKHFTTSSGHSALPGSLPSCSQRSFMTMPHQTAICSSQEPRLSHDFWNTPRAQEKTTHIRFNEFSLDQEKHQQSTEWVSFSA